LAKRWQLGISCLSIVHKERPHTGGFVQCGQEGRVLQIRTSALFDAKNFVVVSKFMVCPHEQGVRGRVEPTQTFCWQGGRRSIFRDFVRTSFI